MSCQEHKKEELTKFVNVLMGASVFAPDSDVGKELLLLKPMLEPLEEKTVESSLEASLLRFRTDKNLKLYKMMNNFSTGLQVLEEGSKALEARAADKRLLKVLETSDKLNVQDPARDIAAFKDVYSDLKIIEANASAMFMRKHADGMRKAEAKVEEPFMSCS